MNIIKRTDTSFLTYLLQLLIKPIGYKLGAPDKVFPAGSPKLKPHATARKRCNIVERQIAGIWVYDLTAKEPADHEKETTSKDTSATRRRIYYIAGGTWQMVPSPQHWKLCAEMCNKIPNCTVTLLSPSLAPNSPAPVAFPQLVSLYDECMAANEQAGETVTFAGDSSGGNIVLSLVLSALSEPAAPAVRAKPKAPDSIFVMSPSVHCTPMDASSHVLKAVQKLDPILRIADSNKGAALWAGAWDPADPRLTPLNADVRLLAEHGVRLFGVTGANDIRTPAALEFRDLCAKEGVQGEWLEWKGQMHCFPIAWVYGLREYKAGKEWIIDVLSR